MYLRKRKKKGEGFTLIELLIVIVIIGILVAIALPNFQAAQNRAKTASLKSNIRSLGIVAQTYSVDWGGNVAENVNVLYNESTTKGYWKDFKNPFTGESGLGFAVANYAQSVTLISSLNKMKLAESVEYLKKEQAIIDTEKTVTDSSQTAASSGGIAAQDVFGETAGMAAYLTDGEEFLLTGSVPLKVGTGVDFLKDPNGKVFALASSNKNKFALKNSYSSSGNYPPFLAKMVDALPQGWKDWIDKHANWWENEGKKDVLTRIQNAKDNLVNAVANLTPDQKADFESKYTAYQDSMNKIKDFQVNNMAKIVEFENLNKETRFKSMEMELQLNKIQNEIMAKVGDYGTLYKSISSSCGWNDSGTYEQNACDTANKEWNTYWDKVTQERENNADYQKMEDERNNMWNNFYNSDTYRTAESKMREEVWNTQDKLFNEMYNAQNNINQTGNNIGNWDAVQAANDITWGGYELNWNDAYQKAGGNNGREIDVAMKAVYIHQEEKLTGVDYLSQYNKK